MNPLTSECRAFFGEAADSVMRVSESCIQINIQGDELLTPVTDFTSCYVFFETHTTRPVYEEYDPQYIGHSHYRKIIGHENVDTQNRFSILAYDSANRSYSYSIQPTKAVVLEYIKSENTLTTVLQRHINIDAVKIRVLSVVRRETARQVLAASIDAVSAFKGFLCGVIDQTLAGRGGAVIGDLEQQDVDDIFEQVIVEQVKLQLPMALRRVLNAKREQRNRRTVSACS